MEMCGRREQDNTLRVYLSFVTMYHAVEHELRVLEIAFDFLKCPHQVFWCGHTGTAVSLFRIEGDAAIE